MILFLTILEMIRNMNKLKSSEALREEAKCKLCVDNNNCCYSSTLESSPASHSKHTAQVGLSVIVQLLVNRIRMTSPSFSTMITDHSPHVQLIVQQHRHIREQNGCIYIVQYSRVRIMKICQPGALIMWCGGSVCLSLVMVPTSSNQKITDPILLDLFLMAFFSGITASQNTQGKLLVVFCLELMRCGRTANSVSSAVAGSECGDNWFVISIIVDRRPSVEMLVVRCKNWRYLVLISGRAPAGLESNTH